MKSQRTCIALDWTNLRVFSSDIFLIIVLSIIGGIVYAVKGGQIKSGMDDAKQKMRVSSFKGRLYMIACELDDFYDGS